MKVFISGAGTMGAGIAQVFALNGHTIFLSDLEEKYVEAGFSAIQKNLARLVKKEAIDEVKMEEILANIIKTTDRGRAEECSLVIEAVVEDMASKKSLFKEFELIAPADAIFATNTSSLSVTEISSTLREPGRLIGIHFFNPAPLMKLVEIVKGVHTSKETLEKTVEIIKTLGKEYVVVNDSCGFIVNRVLIPMINEAAGALSEGVASAEDIDKAMVLGANSPIGPLALGDLIGNDIVLAIMNNLYEEFNDPRYRPHPILKKMVRAGQLGRKTGKGFFNYCD